MLARYPARAAAKPRRPARCPLLLGQQAADRCCCRCGVLGHLPVGEAHDAVAREHEALVGFVARAFKRDPAVDAWLRQVRAAAEREEGLFELVLGQRRSAELIVEDDAERGGAATSVRAFECCRTALRSKSSGRSASSMARSTWVRCRISARSSSVRASFVQGIPSTSSTSSGRSVAALRDASLGSCRSRAAVATPRRSAAWPRAPRSAAQAGGLAANR